MGPTKVSCLWRCPQFIEGSTVHAMFSAVERSSSLDQLLAFIHRKVQQSVLISGVVKYTNLAFDLG